MNLVGLYSKSSDYIHNYNSYNCFIDARFSALRIYSKNRKPYVSEKQREGNKASITHFSNHSRKALLLSLQTINLDDIRKNGYQVLFITLTYQRDFFFRSRVPLDVKVDIDTLDKRLKRYAKKEGFKYTFFYKMEFHRSGVPHLHLFFISTLRHTKQNYLKIRSWFNKSWLSVVSRFGDMRKEEYVKMQKASTNVRYVKTVNSSIIFAYVNKEVSKLPQGQSKIFSPGEIGRFWGIKNKSFFKDISFKVVLEFFNYKSFWRFRRSLLKYYRKKLGNKRAYRNSLKFSVFAGFTAFYLVDIASFIKLYNFYSSVSPDILFLR